MIHPTDAEALSRLLDGELREAEAQALRARLEVEPDLARLWEATRALPGDLAALPETPPPSGLIAPKRRPAVQSPPLPSAPFPSPRLAAAVLLGLAAGLLVTLTRTEPVLALEAGSQRVTGDVTLRAGDARVRVEGDARISVEPAAPLVRENGAEVGMRGSHALAAAGGALVTVAVTQGSAEIWPADGGAPVQVKAGNSATVGGPRVRTAAGGDEPEEKQAPPRDLAEANARIASLQADLQRAKLEAALTRGQLDRFVGKPAEFPADTPAAMRPDAFADTIRQILADTQVPAHLVDADCSEFPCIAWLEPEHPEDRYDQIAPLGEKLSASYYGDNAGIMGMGTQRSTPQGDETLFAVAVVPGGATGPELSARVQQRVQDYDEAHAPDDASEPPR